jgi:hypothetical protein
MPYFRLAQRCPPLPATPHGRRPSGVGGYNPLSLRSAPPARVLPDPDTRKGEKRGHEKREKRGQAQLSCALPADFNRAWPLIPFNRAWPLIPSLIPSYSLIPPGNRPLFFRLAWETVVCP